MKILTAFLIFLVCLKANSSGDRVGNGGDVVKCKNYVEILDLYEVSEALKNFKEKSHKDILTAVLENLKSKNAVQAQQYMEKVKTFFENVEFRTDISLADIDDSKHVYLPKSSECNLLQIAIRKNAASKVTKQFIIDQDMWKQLSERSKASLVLHEIIYEHLFKLGETDSVKARMLNAYMFSERAFTDGPKEHWELIKSLKLPIYK